MVETIFHGYIYFTHRLGFKRDPMGFCNKLPHQKHANNRMKNRSEY
jgi:hypothetical protein